MLIGLSSFAIVHWLLMNDAEPGLTLHGWLAETINGDYSVQGQRISNYCVSLSLGYLFGWICQCLAQAGKPNNTEPSVIETA